MKDAAGDPVKVAGMVLGQIPEGRAQSRNRAVRERGNQLLKQIGQTYKKEGGQTAQAKFPAKEISGDGDISSDWVRCENGVSYSDARANHGRIEAAQAV